MQVQLSSGNYDVIASNEVFLFGDSNELVFRINDDDGSCSHMVLKFSEDPEKKQCLHYEPVGDYDFTINCFNFFSRFGSGLKEPILIGESMGRNVYIIFSTKQHTNKPPYVRSVRFTLYREK
jgi:hypothetical protein